VLGPAEIVEKIKDIGQQLRLIVTKALIDSVDDTTAIQLLKIRVLDSEVFSNIERVQNYGLTSNPPKDSEVVVLENGGSRDNLIAIVCDNSQSRINNLESGEVCLYSENGQKVHLNKFGDTIFNDGSDFAVRFSALETWAKDITTKWNAFAELYVPGSPTVTGAPPKAIPLTTTIDNAKISEIKVP
jgi:phage baseplate assembly protein V